jgi:hypothetical protein
MDHLAGFMIAGPMVLPVPPSAPENLEVFELDGVLYATNTGVTEQMELILDNAAPWSFQSQLGVAGAKVTLTDKDVKAQVGCNASQLPRLIAESTFDLGGEQGKYAQPDPNDQKFYYYDSKGKMHVTLRLIVLTPTSMLGILTFNGSAKADIPKSQGQDPKVNFLMRRSVSMTKN